MSTEARSAAPARTEEMAVIHRIFRRGFPMMAELVLQARSGATARSQPIAAHLDFLLNGLHNHHSGEDETTRPLLLERAALQTELITRMEQQDKVVAERSERVRSLLETGDGPLSRARHWRQRSMSSPPPSLCISTTRKRTWCLCFGSTSLPRSGRGSVRRRSRSSRTPRSSLRPARWRMSRRLRRPPGSSATSRSRSS